MTPINRGCMAVAHTHELRRLQLTHAFTGNFEMEQISEMIETPSDSAELRVGIIGCGRMDAGGHRS